MTDSSATIANPINNYLTQMHVTATRWLIHTVEKFTSTLNFSGDLGSPTAEKSTE